MQNNRVLFPLHAFTEVSFHDIQSTHASSPACHSLGDMFVINGHHTTLSSRFNRSQIYVGCECLFTRAFFNACVVSEDPHRLIELFCFHPRIRLHSISQTVTRSERFRSRTAAEHTHRRASDCAASVGGAFDTRSRRDTTTPDKWTKGKPLRGCTSTPLSCECRRWQSVRNPQATSSTIELTCC